MIGFNYSQKVSKIIIFKNNFVMNAANDVFFYGPDDIKEWVSVYRFLGYWYYE